MPIEVSPRKRKGTMQSSISTHLPNQIVMFVVPVKSTFAIPPVAIVMLKKVQVKCRNLSRHHSVPGKGVLVVTLLGLRSCAPSNAEKGSCMLELS